MSTYFTWMPEVTLDLDLDSIIYKNKVAEVFPKSPEESEEKPNSTNELTLLLDQ